MGDHVTSIAEQVIYVVSGEIPDEDRRKLDRTSFVGKDGG
jgi:phosphate transport system protein